MMPPADIFPDGYDAINGYGLSSLLMSEPKTHTCLKFKASGGFCI